MFTVTRSHGSEHIVFFGISTSDMMPSCTCLDWTTWHIPCKHFLAVFRFYPEWNWNMLPQSYRDSAYLSTDSDSLDTFFDDTVSIEVPRKSQKLRTLKKSQNVLKTRNVLRTRFRSFRYMCIINVITPIYGFIYTGY